MVFVEKVYKVCSKSFYYSFIIVIYGNFGAGTRGDRRKDVVAWLPDIQFCVGSLLKCLWASLFYAKLMKYFLFWKWVILPLRRSLFFFFVKLYQLFATESCCRKVSLGCSVLFFFKWNKYIKIYTITFQKDIFGLKSSYNFKGNILFIYHTAVRSLQILP